MVEDVPDRWKIPEADITMRTGTGAALNCTPGTNRGIGGVDMGGYLYCRVVHDVSFSLKDQAAVLRRYAERAGYTATLYAYTQLY